MNKFIKVVGGISAIIVVLFAIAKWKELHVDTASTVSLYEMTIRK